MDNEVNYSVEDIVSEDVEAIFQLGLKAWENFDAEQDFEKAKKNIGEAKRKGHPLADMYWDIVCAFEEAHKEENM